jgi:hypothetical protein
LKVRQAELEETAGLTAQRLALAREETALARDLVRLRETELEQGKISLPELIEAKIAVELRRMTEVDAELHLCLNQVSRWALGRVIIP